MKKVVTFGEIMLRLAPPGFLRFSQTNNFDAVYGGGESNVAVSLANYGVPVDFVTRLPKNDIGECALMEMRKRGVSTEHIVFGGDRLGIYFLETGAVSRGSKVIYDRAHSAIAEIETGMIDWEQVFEGAGWFHWTGESWDPEPAPVITHPHFTGTGTRFLEANGCDAIEALFDRSFQ